MKSVLKSLFVILIILGVSSQATLAAFTTQARVVANTFSTGTADLRLFRDNSGTAIASNLAPTVAGAPFANIYPGWSQDKPVKLHNSGTVDLITSLSGVLVIETGTLSQVLEVGVFAWNDDGDGVVEAGEEGAAFGDFRTLEQWTTQPFALGELETNTTLPLIIRFRAPNPMDSSYEGLMTIYDFVFDGTTDGAVQEP